MHGSAPLSEHVDLHRDILIDVRATSPPSASPGPVHLQAPRSAVRVRVGPLPPQVMHLFLNLGRAWKDHVLIPALGQGGEDALKPPLLGPHDQ